MKKVLCSIVAASVSTLCFAGKIESAQKAFNKKLQQEVVKLVAVYDSEIKQATKKGKLKEALLMEKKKEAFIEKVQLIKGDITLDGKSLAVLLKGKVFAFGDGGRLHTKNFKLSTTGKITGYKHPNERAWAVNDDGCLVVLNDAGKVQWVFNKKEKKDGKWQFRMTGNNIYLLEI